MHQGDPRDRFRVMNSGALLGTYCFVDRFLALPAIYTALATGSLARAPDTGKTVQVCGQGSCMKCVQIKATPCLGNELRFGEFTDLAARNPGLLLEGEGLQSPLLGQVSVLDACL